MLFLEEIHSSDHQSHSRQQKSFLAGGDFDHLVRSAEQFDYLGTYPKKAGLRESEYLLWRRPSAGRTIVAGSGGGGERDLDSHMSKLVPSIDM
jgi:hypothetical protein